MLFSPEDVQSRSVLHECGENGAICSVDHVTVECVPVRESGVPVPRSVLSSIFIVRLKSSRDAVISVVGSVDLVKKN